MSDYPEPSIEATAEDVEAEARSLHKKWQQPSQDLEVPPSGTWSKLVAARAQYAEIPLSHITLVDIFPERFTAKQFLEDGDMNLQTAHAFEVARKSGLFGQHGATIEFFVDASTMDKRCLAVVGTISAAPTACCFEIAREGEWTYDDLVARRKAALDAAKEKVASQAPNLTRHAIFWGLMVMVIAMALIALVTKIIVLAVVGLVIFVVLGAVLFFTKLYRT